MHGLILIVIGFLVTLISSAIKPNLLKGEAIVSAIEVLGYIIFAVGLFLLATGR